ncbi:hypothetical protein F5Y05DRAFT_421661 [Hypoxylon sp. FL0543]|nr:hypothetical protein F5Y05DRAFT_421661 [Hypoxylon sp. FL0543]
MQSFHFFPRLPQELKDRVWEFAAQNSPGIHFFRLVRGCREWALEAPRHKPQHRPSWTTKNSSYYLHYQALWDTCKASRREVDKYQQSSGVVPLSSMVERNNVPHHAFCNVGQDVICLQPPAYRKDDTPKSQDEWSSTWDNGFLESYWDLQRLLRRQLEFVRLGRSDDGPKSELRLAVDFHLPWWLEEVWQSWYRRDTAFRWARFLLFALEEVAAYDNIGYAVQNADPTDNGFIVASAPLPPHRPVFYVIDPHREPRRDADPGACLRRPVFESTTHDYYVVDQPADELFEKATRRIFMCYNNLVDELAEKYSNDLFLRHPSLTSLTEVKMVAGFPKSWVR